MNRIGTMVATETRGNITRPPNLSVSAPTGTRPSDPTITGTATTMACWEPERPSSSLKRGPSGLSSAQAQKFIAKPSVARASITIGCRLPELTDVPERAGPFIGTPGVAQSGSGSDSTIVTMAVSTLVAIRTNPTVLNKATPPVV